MYNLIHLREDVKSNGTLDYFSAFKFKNVMYELNKLVKDPRNPLQQVANKIGEKWATSVEYTTGQYPKVIKNTSHIISVQMKNFKLSANVKECFITKDSKNISKVILSFSDTDEKYYVVEKNIKTL